MIWRAKQIPSWAVLSAPLTSYKSFMIIKISRSQRALCIHPPLQEISPPYFRYADLHNLTRHHKGSEDGLIE